MFHCCPYFFPNNMIKIINLHNMEGNNTINTNESSSESVAGGMLEDTSHNQSTGDDNNALNQSFENSNTHNSSTFETPKSTKQTHSKNTSNKKSQTKDPKRWWMHLIVTKFQEFLKSTNFVDIELQDLESQMNGLIEESRKTIQDEPQPKDSGLLSLKKSFDSSSIVVEGTPYLLLDCILELSKKVSNVKECISYGYASNFAEIMGEFLFTVVSEYPSRKKDMYGIQRLGEFAVSYYLECPQIWNVQNDDGFIDTFGIFISLIKFDKETTPLDISASDNQQTPSPQVQRNITETSDTEDASPDVSEINIQADDNDKIVSDVISFYSGIKNVDYEIQEKVTCGVVYAVLNPQAAQVMKILIQNKKISFFKDHKPTPIYALFHHFSSTFYHTLTDIQTYFIPYFDTEFVSKQGPKKVDSKMLRIWATMLNNSWYVGPVEEYIPKIIKYVLDLPNTSDLSLMVLKLLYELLKINFENPRILDEKKTDLDFKFVELISNATELAKVRDVFDILPPPQKQTVYRGPYTLCQVVPILNVDKNGYHAYEIVKSSPLNPTKKYGNTPVFLHKSVFEEPKWITIKQGMSPEDKKQVIMQELLSKKRYARVASWNVACMNNFDLPTTEEQLGRKLKNIAEVIINSNCDIVALQELPYVITLQETIQSGSSPKKTQEKFDYLRQRLQDRLQEVSNDSWVIEWSTSFYENYDARKGRGVLAFAYNSDVVEAQHPYNVELRVNDKRKEETRVKRMPICGSFRIGMLEFILVNVHLSPKNADHEANDLAANLIPKLEEHYGSLKSQSVIFLGDFNMSYTTKGMFAKPKPGDDTWSPFIQNGFVPCIKDCFTNVVQSNCYDNIWVHKTMTSVLHKNPKALGLEEKGVKEIIHILEPGKRILKSDMKAFFQKQASDHNLVFIDLRIHKVMPWSESIRIEEKYIDKIDSN